MSNHTNTTSVPSNPTNTTSNTVFTVNNHRQLTLRPPVLFTGGELLTTLTVDNLQLFPEIQNIGYPNTTYVDRLEQLPEVNRTLPDLNATAVLDLNLADEEVRLRDEDELDMVQMAVRKEDSMNRDAFKIFDTMWQPKVQLLRNTSPYNVIAMSIALTDDGTISNLLTLQSPLNFPYRTVNPFGTVMNSVDVVYQNELLHVLARELSFIQIGFLCKRQYYMALKPEDMQVEFTGYSVELRDLNGQVTEPYKLSRAVTDAIRELADSIASLLGYPFSLPYVPQRNIPGLRRLLPRILGNTNPAPENTPILEDGTFSYLKDGKLKFETLTTKLLRIPVYRILITLDLKSMRQLKKDKTNMVISALPVSPSSSSSSGNPLVDKSKPFGSVACMVDKEIYKILESILEYYDEIDMFFAITQTSNPLTMGTHLQLLGLQDWSYSSQVIPPNHPVQGYLYPEVIIPLAKYIIKIFSDGIPRRISKFSNSIVNPNQRYISRLPIGTTVPYYDRELKYWDDFVVQPYRFHFHVTPRRSFEARRDLEARMRNLQCVGVVIAFGLLDASDMESDDNNGNEYSVQVSGYTKYKSNIPSEDELILFQTRHKSHSLQVVEEEEDNVGPAILDLNYPGELYTTIFGDVTDERVRKYLDYLSPFNEHVVLVFTTKRSYNPTDILLDQLLTWSCTSLGDTAFDESPPTDIMNYLEATYILELVDYLIRIWNYNPAEHIIKRRRHY